MPLNLDRYLMLLLRQFHLEHIQSLAEALTTVIAGGHEGESDGESKEERASKRQLLIG